MASPVADMIASDIGVTPEQSRVQSLFVDAASDDTPVTYEEQTNLMHTSRAQHEHDDQLTTTMTVVDTLQDVPTGRHGSAARLQPTDDADGGPPPVRR